MIVRHFLDWVRTAPAGKRAEATSALARAYLYSDLSPDDRRRRRRRDADAARRPFAVGAPGAGRRAGGKPERAAGHRAGARRRSAANRCAGPGAVAAFRRCRSGRCGGDRKQPRCRRRSQAAQLAALGRSCHRRSRHRGSLPRACGKQRRRHRAVLDRSDGRTLWASRRHSRSTARARGYRGCDAADAGRQGVGDAGWTSSPHANGSMPGMLSGSRARRAKRRRSRLRPKRPPPKCARSSIICASAGSSPPA